MPELTKDAMLVRCAYLFYQERLNIQDISRRLGISRFRVSRYLKEAEERGIVEIRIRAPDLDCETASLKIEERYGVKRAVVVPVSREMDSEMVRRAVGQKGAELLKETSDGVSIGISWGRTIAHMVEDLPDGALNAKRITEFTGGLGMINAEFPTSALASLFAKKVGASCYQMSGPIIASDAGIARNVLSDVSLKRTLAMGRESDIAICGVATLETDSMLYHAGLMDERDFAHLIERGAVGSIIGRFFDAAGQEIESPYKERSIAIAWDDFLQIPERIILPGGWKKLSCIRGLLSGSIPTTLVLDSVTATELLRIDFQEGENDA